MLHPNKNKSVGTKGALMLIRKAWGMLSKKDKTSTYDKKRNTPSFQL